MRQEASVVPYPTSTQHLTTITFPFNLRGKFSISWPRTYDSLTSQYRRSLGPLGSSRKSRIGSQNQDITSQIVATFSFSMARLKIWNGLGKFLATPSFEATGQLLDDLGWKNHFTKQLDEKLQDPKITCGVVRTFSCGKPSGLFIAAPKAQGSCPSIAVNVAMNDGLAAAGIADFGAISIMGEQCCVEADDRGLGWFAN